jgi:hypothetical protein
MCGNLFGGENTSGNNRQKAIKDPKPIIKSST